MNAIITYDTVCSCLNQLQVQVRVYIQYHNRAHFHCESNEVQMLLQKNLSMTSQGLCRHQVNKNNQVYCSNLVQPRALGGSYTVFGEQMHLNNQ